MSKITQSEIIIDILGKEDFIIRKKLNKEYWLATKRGNVHYEIKKHIFYSIKNLLQEIALPTTAGVINYELKSKNIKP